MLVESSGKIFHGGYIMAIPKKWTSPIRVLSCKYIDQAASPAHSPMLCAAAILGNVAHRDKVKPNSRSYACFSPVIWPTERFHRTETAGSEYPPNV